MANIDKIFTLFLFFFGLGLLIVTPSSAQRYYMDPVQVTPRQLMEDYKKNFHAADANYTGKLVILTGRIDAVNPPNHPYRRHDHPYLVMNAGQGNQPLVIYMWEWETDKMQKVNPGSSLSIMGFCQGVLPQMTIYDACIYPSGCGGPVPDFYGPHYKLPPSK